MTAGHSTPGTFSGEGRASMPTSLGNTLRPTRPCNANHGGVGNERNGARMTDFCARENIKVLCTTPVPDWMSLIGWPG